MMLSYTQETRVARLKKCTRIRPAMIHLILLCDDRRRLAAATRYYSVVANRAILCLQPTPAGRSGAQGCHFIVLIAFMTNKNAARVC